MEAADEGWLELETTDGMVRIGLNGLKAQLAPRKLFVIDELDQQVLEACKEAEITPSRILKGRSEWRIVRAILAARREKPVVQ